MDDRKLEVFFAVIEYGSFSKASEHLQCTQSAVTQTMNRLETELGCNLLYRHHSGVKLTEQGETLLPKMRAAFEALQTLQTQASLLSTKEHSTIRIGTFSSIANTWLPQLLIDYRQANPHVTFDIKITTGDLQDQLFDKEIDLGFGDRLRLSKANFLPLMEDPFYAVVPKDQRMKNGEESAIVPCALSESFLDTSPTTIPTETTVPLEDVIALPFLMAPMNALDQILPTIPDAGIHVDCDDDGILLNMVRQGVGATVMPELSLIQSGAEDVRIFRTEPELHRTLGIGYTKESSRAAMKFARFVAERMKH